MTVIPSATDPVSPADPTKPDLAGAISKVREERADAPTGPRKRGRPKGSGKKKSAPIEPEDRQPIEVSETDIQGATFLAGVTWKLAGKMIGCRELDKSESRELGEALAPVLAKYLPIASEYGPEIALAVTIFGLYEKTHVPKGKAEIIEDADGEEHVVDFSGGEQRDIDEP